MQTEKDKLQAAIEVLESEQNRRIEEKVQQGTAVRSELVVVLRGADNEVEDAKAAKLAELRARGEQRDIIFDVTCISTGVPRAREINNPQPSTADDYRPDYTSHLKTYGPTKPIPPRNKPEPKVEAPPDRCASARMMTIRVRLLRAITMSGMARSMYGPSKMEAAR